MLKELKKLSPELLYTLQKQNQSNTLVIATTRIQKNRTQKNWPELLDEMELQICQYGPETTVGELIPMAKNERPEKLSLRQLLYRFR